jgi:hypothetical protein
VIHNAFMAISPHLHLCDALENDYFIFGQHSCNHVAAQCSHQKFKRRYISS